MGGLPPLASFRRRRRLARKEICGFPKILGPEYSTLNSRVLIIRTPKQGALIFGNSQICGCERQVLLEDFPFCVEKRGR